MRKIKWTVSIGLVGCQLHGEIEVDDDTDGDDIDSMVENAALERVEWWWEEGDKP